MIPNLAGFVLFIVIVVIPAYYINKWMIKVTSPRESFGRLFLYILLSVFMAVAYTSLFICIITTIYPMSRK